MIAQAKNLFTLASATALIAAIAAPAHASYSSTVIADGAVHYWRFEDASSLAGETALDSGSSPNNGVYTNTAAGILVPGIIAGGNAVHLDGIDDRINVSGSIPIGASVTVEAWVKSDNTFWYTSGDQCCGFVSVRTGAPAGTAFQFGPSTSTSSKGLELDWSGGGFYDGTPAGDIDDAFHHYVWTYDQGTTTAFIYKDGVQYAPDANGSGRTGTNVPDLNIGWDFSTRFLDGMIDEVAIYSTVLTPTQILNHYTLGSQEDAPSVPEPSTYALGLIGLAGLGLIVWRKRRRHA